MQVGEQHLALPQHRALGRLRLFHLDDHVGRLEHRGRIGQDLGTRGRVRIVADLHAAPGAGLDQHLVAARGQLAHAGRHQPDPVLVRLDLLGYADPHPVLLSVRVLSMTRNVASNGRRDGPKSRRAATARTVIRAAGRGKS